MVASQSQNIGFLPAPSLIFAVNVVMSMNISILTAPGCAGHNCDQKLHA